MDGKLEYMEKNILESLMGGYLKLIRCVKGIMKIKVATKLNNFPIIRIFQGEVMSIMELLMDGLKKE
jgi:hypothetical protein